VVEPIHLLIPEVARQDRVYDQGDHDEEAGEETPATFSVGHFSRFDVSAVVFYPVAAK
jgi:hypothetical protein